MITKSKYMAGLSCLRYMWHMDKDPSKLPEFDDSTRFKMSQGYDVQKYAEELINGEAEKKVVYDDLYSRADIIADNCVYEVKASNSVKTDHIEDISFQRYVYRKAGRNYDKYFIVYLDKEYVREGEIDPKGLLKIEEVKDFVSDSVIEERLSEMRAVLRSDTPPRSTCRSPGDCGGLCWDLPPGNVFELNRGGKKAIELYEEGIILLKDIPDDFKLNAKQNIQKEGKVHIDKEGISNWFSSLKDPIYYFDFETFSTAVPMFENSRPWQQIPFQFSCHVKDKHFEFLFQPTGGSVQSNDPRPSLISALKCLGNEGSIVVYYKSFEITRLKELARDFPEHSKYLLSLVERIVDLYDVFGGFMYYDPVQNGSASIKKVLPALTSLSYEGMKIANGGDASVMFYKMAYENGEDVREALLEYCKLDTLAEVKLMEELRKLI